MLLLKDITCKIIWSDQNKNIFLLVDVMKKKVKKKMRVHSPLHPGNILSENVLTRFLTFYKTLRKNRDVEYFAVK
jgi:hypothetical protein